MKTLIRILVPWSSSLLGTSAPPPLVCGILSPGMSSWSPTGAWVPSSSFCLEVLTFYWLVSFSSVLVRVSPIPREWQVQNRSSVTVGSMNKFQFSSVQFSRSVVSDSLRPHELQHARPPCPSPIPGVYPNPCPLSRWCHPNISSSVIPFSFCPQSFPASGSFPMSQLFTLVGQSIGVSASTSVLPMNTQDWSPLGWTGWISLLSKGLSRVFSNTTVHKHQFFVAQLSLESNSHIHTWLLEKQ